MKKRPVIFFFMITGIAVADQAEWVSKADADRAAQMIDPGIELRKFCRPCGDSSWTSINVDKIEVRNTSEK